MNSTVATAPPITLTRWMAWSFATIVTALFMVAVFIGPFVLAVVLPGPWGNAYVLWAAGLGAPVAVVFALLIRRRTRSFGVATAIGWLIGIGFFIALGVFLSAVLD